jgi:poly(A) polymerase
MQPVLARARLLVFAAPAVYSARVSRLRENATHIVRTLRQAGHEAYFVGGCVRDELRGVEPKDYDVATSARPEIIQQLFPHTVPVGAAFGVVLVLVDDVRFEVATFRSDDSYTDGRRPDHVTFTDARHDAERRDFTINGLFLDPIASRVLDFVGGQQDLQRKLVRTIGPPEDRFTEDKLRMLRCVRLASTLGYEIEPNTFAAVRAMASQIGHVSAERIRDELIKMFTGGNAGRGLQLLDDSGLLHEILPEVEAMKGVAQPPQFHPEGDVFTHTKLMMDELRAPSTVLAFACLLHDVGKPATFTVSQEKGGSERIRFHEHDQVGVGIADAILRRLRFSNDEREQILACVDNHMTFKDVTQMRRATLRRLLARPTFAEEMELHRIDCQSSHRDLGNYEFLKAKQAEFAAIPPKPPPLISGHDLIALGMTPGPSLGKLLREVEEQQLEDKLRTREEALEFARSRLRETA